MPTQVNTTGKQEIVVLKKLETNEHKELYVNGVWYSEWENY